MFVEQGGQGVVVILDVTKHRLQTRVLFRRDAFEQLWRSGAVIHVGPSDHHRHTQAERIHQQISLAAFDVLAAVISSLLTAHIGRLRRLAVDADRARRILTARGVANPRPQGNHDRGQRAVVSPLRKVFIRGALGL